MAFTSNCKKNWFDSLELKHDKLQGSFAVSNPDVKFLLYRIFKESKITDELTALAVESLLLQTLHKMETNSFGQSRAMPLWVDRVKQLLHDDPAQSYTLHQLALILQIHPVHLSRDFSKYFNCNMGEYIRKLRVERSFTLLTDNHLSLTEIAFECGFADQSHFVRNFKLFGNGNPSAYRKLLARIC